MLLSVVLLLLRIIQNVGSIYRLYYTNGHFQYDCLNYFVRNDIVQYKKPVGVAYQIIPHCFRPVDPRDDRQANDQIGRGQPMTFKDLREKKVTAEDLFRWSASIDLIERYEVSHPTSLDVYYNCSSAWFGDRCQYTFAQPMGSFADIVNQTFLAKGYGNFQSPLAYTNLSCYVLVHCRRGPAPMCLDWREICDGRMDCLDGGQDEENCFQLETNECADDQFRCRDGTCIPEAFLHDDELNPDCVDGTDEAQISSYTKQCYRDPAFRCSERRGASSSALSCGDDGYNSQHQPPTTAPGCFSDRDVLFSTAIWSYLNHNDSLSLECWLILSCAQNLDGISMVDCDDFCELEMCLELIEEACPTSFFFPNYPIVGHIRLLYYSDDLHFTNLLIPNYVCFDHRSCDFFRPNRLVDNFTCVNFEVLGVSEEGLSQWELLSASLVNIFSGCSASSGAADVTDCQSSSLFPCGNSSKCISKHRLMDGVEDCHVASDERFSNSCAIDPKNRFRCLSGNICVPPCLVLNGVKDCPHGDDEIEVRHEQQNIEVSFINVCDGFVDSISSIDNNGTTQTDETNCERWQCDNHYTHCDGVWNCPNGTDEVACQPSSCAPNQHPCLHAVTYEPICLPLARAGDGKIDCLGSYDERAFCREQLPNDLDQRYKCQHSMDCAPVRTMCQFATFCREDRVNMCPVIAKAAGVFKHLTDANRVPKYFSLSSTHQRADRVARSNTFATKSTIGFREAWLCNRGVLVYHGKAYEERCLCPPTHYGDRCQYQNERVSLTIRFGKETAYHLWRHVFRFVLMLVDDDEQMVHSYDQILYVYTCHCPLKYNLHLLYRTRPKNASKKFSIRIDAFAVSPLYYYTSWHLSHSFPFLPVHRLATILTIPPQASASSRECQWTCLHGQCYKYANKNLFFCRCETGWQGAFCDIVSVNQCARQSIQVGTYDNQSICVCPLHRFGPRCFLTHSVCQRNPCQHGGLCVPDDERVSEHGFSCLCSQGYSGETCQTIDIKIIISFDRVPIPSTIFAHFITAYNDAHPSCTTMLKKIPVDQQTVTFYTSTEFHLLFAQIERLFYIVIVQEQHVPSANVSSVISPSHRCLSIAEVYNSTVSTLPLLRRVKYYHSICRDNPTMRCFYDDVHLCLCTAERYGNCFQFDHRTNYHCRGQDQYCQNGAECFQDKTDCPSALVCACRECYFGSRCQLSTKGFGLSLDSILGYLIKLQVPLRKQSWPVIVSIAVTTVMFTIGLISGILSLITFRSKKLRATGCCLYLIASSITSLTTTVTFQLKLWLLIVSHMGLIANRSFLLFQCITVDFMLVSFLNMNSWFSACVAFDRAMIVLKGVHSNQKKSKQMARWILLVMAVLNLGTHVHDPLHRHLIDDVEEQRTWCVASYSTTFTIFNSAMNTFHFVTPYCINLISVMVIIVVAARYRDMGHTWKTYKQHLRRQLHEHKHLLISPCILILLGIPRLIIAFSSECMKSARDPWLFLFGYFISFIPSISTFIVFVVPSKTYKKELSKSLNPVYMTLKKYLSFSR